MKNAKEKRNQPWAEPKQHQHKKRTPVEKAKTEQVLLGFIGRKCRCLCCYRDFKEIYIFKINDIQYNGE